MIAYHEVPPEQFAALGSGLGGAATVADLAAAQRSKRLLLLRHLSTAGCDRDAIDVLIEADRRDRRAVTELLDDPLVGAWLAWTVRRHLGHAESAVPLAEDVAQLGAVAAVAALRAGVDTELHTRTRWGAVTLPTLGTAVHCGDGPALITVSGGRATVSGPSATVRAADDDQGWQPLRRLRARHGDRVATVAVEDGNPYRDCYHASPAGRFGDAEFTGWQDRYAEAWALLAGCAPERADELTVGLRSLVPLVTDDSGVARSGTARDAFGTMGLTRPRSATEFAVTLVHEFQHSKLSALLDLVPLVVPGGTERHFAPWRVDARPTGGLIQGVYAFLGVADTWRALLAAPALADEAAREFAVVRTHVDVGLAALESSGELTPRGRVLAGHLRTALDALLAVPVPVSASATADDSLRRRRAAWTAHNSRVVTSGAPAKR
ncbi:HEXXH motif-containing protein [Krasilnikovia cinnamomea]|uniref:HEXXH motif-containing protein n=1 Tax=Krasilnikovia cinnamomea TaxID=349313 RepID=A0A4Q7ZPS9_9ACTN|nr:HEXXH motif domain-containing protein [Krasilnikovia cinnamomea]RZU52349.1 HEXXH motif-containing protein [Krasilnikovia cinnamomea]